MIKYLKLQEKYILDVINFNRVLWSEKIKRILQKVKKKSTTICCILNKKYLTFRLFE